MVTFENEQLICSSKDTFDNSLNIFGCLAIAGVLMNPLCQTEELDAALDDNKAVILTTASTYEFNKHEDILQSDGEGIFPEFKTLGNVKANVVGIEKLTLDRSLI